MKNILLMVVGISLSLVVGVNAALIQSDNFDDGITGDQWVVSAVSPHTVVEDNGVVRTSKVTSGPGYSAVGYQTAAGYTLSGNFDVSIDADYISVAGTYVYSRLLVEVDSLNTANIMHRFSSSVGWQDVSTIKAAGVSTAETVAAGRADSSLRITRVGDVLSIYAGTMGAGTWDLRYFVNGFSTADVTKISFINSGGPNIGLVTDWDNFTVVPEPATIAFLGTGLCLLCRKRRKN